MNSIFRLTLLCCIILIANYSLAQDTIYLSSNRKIVGKVLEINTYASRKQVLVKKNNTIFISYYYSNKIDSIVFENGAKEIFRTYNTIQTLNNTFGINILKLSYGILEVSYERRLSDKFNLKFPVSLSFPGVINPEILYHYARQVHSAGSELMFFTNPKRDFYIGISQRFGVVEQRAEYLDKIINLGNFNYQILFVEVLEKTFFISSNFTLGANKFFSDNFHLNIFGGMGLNYYPSGYTYEIYNSEFNYKRKHLFFSLIGGLVYNFNF